MLNYACPRRGGGFKTRMSWEVGSQISVGCPKRQRREGIFNVLHAGCIDLFWNDPINHLVQCTVQYLKKKHPKPQLMVFIKITYFYNHSDGS